MKTLVVGLGNTGTKYKNHRHNIGSEAVSRICKKKNINLIKRSKFKSKIADDPNGVTYLIPDTFMNLSGQSLASFLRNKSIKEENIFVVYDDLDLEVGIIRLKKGGGTGGHNGVRSLMSCVADGRFNRIRIGIGRPNLAEDISNYVLSSPSLEEKILLDKSIDRIVESIDLITSQAIELSMNLFNRRK